MRSIFVILLMFFFSNSYSQKIKKYWPNGNIKVKGIVVNGVRKGVWKSYYESGELEQSGKFMYHKGSSYQDGEMTTYFKNGKVKYKHVYNFIDRKEERTEWDSMGTKVSYAKSMVLNSNDNEFELECILYTNGKDSRDHFIMLSTGMEISYVSYYNNELDTNEVLQIKSVDTLLFLPWKNELLNTYTPASFSFDALQNFYQSVLTDKKKILMYAGVWRKRTEGGKPLDEIVYKKGKKYDQLTKVYKADTLAYSRYLFEKDTFYIYPTRAIVVDKNPKENPNTTIFTANKSTTAGLVIIDINNQPCSITFTLPFSLPSSFPDGKWLLLWPASAFEMERGIAKKYADQINEQIQRYNYSRIKENSDKIIVLQYGIFKNGKRENESYVCSSVYSDSDVIRECSRNGLRRNFQDTMFNISNNLIKGRISFGRVGVVISFSNGHPKYYTTYNLCGTQNLYQEINDSTNNGNYWMIADKMGDFGNGIIRKGEFKNGKLDGYERVYDKEGMVLQEKKYSNHQLLHTKYYDTQGKLFQEIIYLVPLGRENKKVKVYEQGKLVMEEFFKNGHSYKTIYYKNGKVVKIEGAPVYE